MLSYARVRLASLVLVWVLAGATPIQAGAGELEKAKESGQVGERFDGFLGVTDEAAPTHVKALVEQINAKRAEKYEGVASKNRIDDEKVGRIAGKKLVERAKPGQFVMPKQGRWKQVD